MTSVAIEKPEEREITKAEPNWSRPVFRPKVDILERSDEVTVMADIPGSNAENVDIHFENETLSLHAKVDLRGPGQDEYMLREYGVGDYHRTFHVGKSIDATRISAEYEDGVLILHLPKTEAVKPRRITVKVS
jgi:HSP20 family protein